MEIRTDLAMEKLKLHPGQALPKGVSMRQETRHGINATLVEITGKAGETALGKPRGTYITVEIDQLFPREQDTFSGAVQCISEYLCQLMNLPGMLPVMVAGLGNREITPDAVGPLTADRILATRHLRNQEAFSAFRPVTAFSPGVLGTTGMESAAVISALAEKSEAAAVIAVDAIAARETRRLCSTVQLSNTGITPGSGIGNHREALDRKTIGVPVIAVGVPTVTDAATMAIDLLERAGIHGDQGALYGASGGMIVTGSNVDVRVREISRLLAYAINLALHPNLTEDMITDLVF